MRILIHTRRSVWSIGSRGIERVHNLDWKRASEAFEALFKAQRIKTQAEIDNAPFSAEVQGRWQATDDMRLP